MPGGCAIGDRPIDLHVRGLQALGADVDLDSGDIVAQGQAAARGASCSWAGRSARPSSAPPTS